VVDAFSGVFNNFVAFPLSGVLGGRLGLTAPVAKCGVAGVVLWQQRGAHAPHRWPIQALALTPANV
jgi:hypothetical protein